MTDHTRGDNAAIQADILKFIHEELVAGDVAVGAGDDLLTGELLDSLAILRLATYVDEKFKIGRIYRKDDVWKVFREFFRS